MARADPHSGVWGLHAEPGPVVFCLCMGCETGAPFLVIFSSLSPLVHALFAYFSTLFTLLSLLNFSYINNMGSLLEGCKCSL